MDFSLNSVGLVILVAPAVVVWIVYVIFASRCLATGFGVRLSYARRRSRPNCPPGPAAQRQLRHCRLSFGDVAL